MSAEETVLKRARPTNALGGTPRKDHLFAPDKRALCGGWLYGGGREVAAEDVDVEDEDLCKACARKAAREVGA